MRLFALLTAALITAKGASAATTEAVAVEPGQAFVSELSPDGDVDAYALDLIAGERIDVIVRGVAAGRREGSGLAAVHVELLAPDGATLVADDEARRRARLTGVEAESSGTYTVRVSGVGTGAYLLRTHSKRSHARWTEWESFGEAASRDVPFDAAARATLLARIQYRGGLLLLSSLRHEGGAATGFDADADAGQRGRIDRGMLRVGPFELQDGAGSYALRLERELGAPEFRSRIQVSRERLSRAERRVHVVSPEEPTITQVAPTEGRPRTEVVLTGDGLSAEARVSFGGVRAQSVRLGSDGRLFAVVPEGAPLGVVDVRYEGDDGQAFVAEGAFVVVPLATVDGFDPAAVPASGGVTLRVSGTGFRAEDRVSIADVRIGATPPASPTEFVVTLPRLPSGLATVAVEDPVGNRATASARLDVRAAPELDTLTPSVIPASAGTQIVALGRNFGTDVSVTVGTTTVDTERISDMELRFDAPLLSPGTRDVVVTDAFGQSGRLADGLVQFALGEDANLLPQVQSDDLGGDAVAAADLDGDSDIDLLVTAAAPLGGGRSATRLLRNDGGTFVDRTGEDLPAPSASDGGDALGVVCVDLDGDDIPEILRVRDDGSAYPGTSSQLRVWERQEDGSYRDATTQFVEGPTATHDLRGVALQAADIDGDGDPDVVITGQSTFTALVGLQLVERTALRVLVNDDGTLVDQSDQRLPAVADSGDALVGDALACADLDGDGRPEIVLSRAEGGSGTATRVLANDGQGAFALVASAMPATSGAERWQASSLALADIDADGDRDLVLGLTERVSDTRSATRLLLNNGAARFTDATTAVLSGADALAGSSADHFEAHDLRVADIDLDGDADLVLGTRAQLSGGPSLRVLLRSPAGNFQVLGTDVAADGSDPWPAAALVVRDIDGDGDPDVVVADSSAGSGDPRLRILVQQR